MNDTYPKRLGILADFQDRCLKLLGQASMGCDSNCGYQPMDTAAAAARVSTPSFWYMRVSAHGHGGSGSAGLDAELLVSLSTVFYSEPILPIPFACKTHKVQFKLQDFENKGDAYTDRIKALTAALELV